MMYIDECEWLGSANKEIINFVMAVSPNKKPIMVQLKIRQNYSEKSFQRNADETSANIISASQVVYSLLL